MKKNSNYLDEIIISLPDEKLNVNETFVLETLRTEYFHIQEAIDAYDSKLLTIKSWSITFSLVIIGTAITSNNSDIYLLACFSAVSFWILETYWKIFQTAFYTRAFEIELFLNGKKIDKFRLINLMGSFQYEFKKYISSRYFSIMFRPQVYMPHLLIVIASLLIWLMKIS